MQKTRKPFQIEGPKTIPEMLSASAARFEAKVALQIHGPQGEWRRLTYVELGQAALAFAAGLVALGFRPGEHAAIILENGLEWGVGYLGVVCAGGVGVPIYYESRPEEIEYILRESGARAVVVSQRLLGFLPPPGELPCLDLALVVDGAGEAVALSPWAGTCVPFAEVPLRATAESRESLANVRRRPDDLLHILYTSGTTGNPKGVMLTHANVIANVEQGRRRVRVDYRDHVLHVLPLHHSYTLLAGLLLPVAIGATVTYENDLRRVAERMGEIRPTVFLGVPALYSLMLRRIVDRAEEEGKGATLRRALRIVETVKRITGVNIGPLLFKGSIHQRLGGRLRFLFSGGAALPPELVRQYANLGLLLVQGYGLTEAAPVAAVQETSTFKFHFTHYYERQLGSVGPAVDGMEIRLIDVPDKHIYVHERGEGELVLRGPNVMAGYFRNQSATRAVFTDSDSGSEPWFLTGDVGRVDAHGNIYITGRAKDVIVLASGEKVYPEELEEKLPVCRLVEEFAIVGRLAPVVDGSAAARGSRDGNWQASPTVEAPSGAQLAASSNGDGPIGHAGRAAEAAGRVRVWAVVFPNYDGLRERSEREGDVLTAERAHEWVASELRLIERDVTPFKRISGVTLIDTPLPKTALRKVKRALLARSLAEGTLGFDLEQLRQNSTGLARAGTAGAGPPR